MKPLRPFPAALALAAFMAVGFEFTRAFESWKDYRAQKPVDRSAAELSLDQAEIRAAAGFVALAIGGAAARLALARDTSSDTGRESGVEDPGSRPE